MLVITLFQTGTYPSLRSSSPTLFSILNVVTLHDGQFLLASTYSIETDEKKITLVKHSILLE